MEDPAEIAVLTSEFVSSTSLSLTQDLDNLPLEVSHVMREIELKDGKVQDILSRIATKQAQMREIYTSVDNENGSHALSDTNKAKIDKLASRISAEYARAEEWSAQKRSMALALWRKAQAHYTRLLHDVDQIHPDLVASAAATVPKPAEIVAPNALPMAIAEAGFGDNDEAQDTKVKRKRAPATSSDYTRQSPMSGYNRHDRSHSHSNRQTPTVDDDSVTMKDRSSVVFPELEDERDENLYCFCQRGSFGEMIGCDSDDCKYEWFHIGCVGVSKPLPQTWVCSDCLAKNKKRRRA